jgi:hypothetical protein
MTHQLLSEPCLLVIIQFQVLINQSLPKYSRPTLVADLIFFF